MGRTEPEENLNNNSEDMFPSADEDGASENGGDHQEVDEDFVLPKRSKIMASTSREDGPSSAAPRGHQTGGSTRGRGDHHYGHGHGPRSCIGGGGGLGTGKVGFSGTSSTSVRSLPVGNIGQQLKSTVRPILKPAAPRPRSDMQNNKRPVTNIEIEEDDESDEDQGSSGDQVHQILSRLNSEFKQRFRVKKQKLDECFAELKSTPRNIFNGRKRVSEQRQKLIDVLKADMGKVNERLEAIVQLYAANEEKNEKMLQSLVRGYEQLKAGITECAKGQAQLYEKFTSELQKLDEAQETRTQDVVERCIAKLRDIQQKLGAEFEKMETESLKNISFF